MIEIKSEDIRTLYMVAGSLCTHDAITIGDVSKLHTCRQNHRRTQRVDHDCCSTMIVAKKDAKSSKTPTVQLFSLLQLP